MSLDRRKFLAGMFGASFAAKALICGDDHPRRTRGEIADYGFSMRHADTYSEDEKKRLRKEDVALRKIVEMVMSGKKALWVHAGGQIQIWICKRHEMGMVDIAFWDEGNATTQIISVSNCERVRYANGVEMEDTMAYRFRIAIAKVKDPAAWMFNPPPQHLTEREREVIHRELESRPTHGQIRIPASVHRW